MFPNFPNNVQSIIDEYLKPSLREIMENLNVQIDNTTNYFEDLSLFEEVEEDDVHL